MEHDSNEADDDSSTPHTINGPQMPCQRVESQAIEVPSSFRSATAEGRRSSSHEATEGSTKLRGLVMERSRACAAYCLNLNQVWACASALLGPPHRPLRLAIHRRTKIVADTIIVIGRYIIAMKPVVAAAPMLRLASSDRPRVEKGLSLTR